MDEENHKRRRAKHVRRIVRVSLAVLVFGYFGWFFDSNTRPSFRDPMTDAWFYLSAMGGALGMYERANEGRLPDRLDDIGTFFQDQPDPLHHKWIYFAGFTGADPPVTILIASARTFSRSDEIYELTWRKKGTIAWFSRWIGGGRC